MMKHFAFLNSNQINNNSAKDNPIMKHFAFLNSSRKLNNNSTKDNTMNSLFSFHNLDTKIEDLIRRTPGLGSKRDALIEKWQELRDQKLNIMITGATGCGKSSTINALFNMDAATMTEVAKVGVGVDPQTMDITKYEIGNMVLWDSPGLGDGKDADLRHSKYIIDKLYERDENGKPLIDLVLVILDGSTRDLGTSYELINKVIIPNLGDDKEQRILVAINQADMAMKGRNWDYESNCPAPALVEHLEEKCLSVRRRILEGTGVDVTPIYYSAGYKEDGQDQGRPYNLAKLLYFILMHIPAEKRVVAALNANQNTEMWQDNDSEDYGSKIKLSLKDAITTSLKGAALGALVGSTFGPVGTAIGTVAGAVIGFIGGLFG